MRTLRATLGKLVEEIRSYSTRKILFRLGLLQFIARIFRLKVSASLYLEDYYLSDGGCDGYREFAVHRGQKLPVRLEAVLSEMGNVEGHSILDLGCGRGELLFHLEISADRVVGIDYSSAAIEICRKFVKKAHLIHADIVQFLPCFEAPQFDHALMIDVVEHLFDWELEIVFKHVARLLKNNGLLYVDTPLLSKRAYSVMHVNIKHSAEQYLPFLPHFAIEKVVSADPSGSDFLIKFRKSRWP
ncbi:MAG: class I SAM-dependent methyltransferase [Deltaproteobacteria bacterium]|nr:class I SAM-dependent methyltransferase [Deltaproteobacteria bacterium]